MKRRSFLAALALAPRPAPAPPRRFLALRYDAARLFCVQPLPGADPPRGETLPESDRDDLTIADFFAAPPPTGPFALQPGAPVTVAGAARLFDFTVARLVSVDDCGRPHTGALLRVEEPHSALWQDAGEAVTLAWPGRNPAGWRPAGPVEEVTVSSPVARRLERLFRSLAPQPRGRFHAAVQSVPRGPEGRTWSVRAGWLAEGEDEPASAWHAWTTPGAAALAQPPAAAPAQPFSHLPEVLGACLLQGMPHLILRTRGEEDITYRLWTRLPGSWEKTDVEYSTGC